MLLERLVLHSLEILVLKCKYLKLNYSASEKAITGKIKVKKYK